MKNSNLGGYQTLTTVAKMLGGPLHLVVGLVSCGIFIISAILAAIKAIFL